MLKKSDLAKQFELVVQQEIKNYQDSLNFVLQSLNELRDSIRQVQEESLKNHAKIHSMQTQLSIELQSVKEVSLSIGLRLEKSLNDQRTVNERNAYEMRDIADAVLTKIRRDDQLEEKIKSLWNAIGDVNHSVEKNQKIFNYTADDLLHKLNNAILKVKKEILEAPTEASLVKTQLEEKLACHTVDVAGIMKELNIYKKENYVTQKKIENIYTLIERLKK